ncbi:MAG: hypothetical protein NXY57DRAFT_1021355 [Lentinula lateritia]|uniref:Secreted protein n=1 Tax=Lentinula lateritia TaxID=40482 RepID=A0ABQ8V702_9AGAR|nr:MAG: hypothetical protein NXY57DRAFT_1021355 [Lentinula lateritia]KAJ4472371.1 hypothetical protein C8R41DRAFT_850047 [Lentinula lateritia]
MVPRMFSCILIELLISTQDVGCYQVYGVNFVICSALEPCDDILPDGHWPNHVVRLLRSIYLHSGLIWEEEDDLITVNN